MTVRRKMFHARMRSVEWSGLVFLQTPFLASTLNEPTLAIMIYFLKWTSLSTGFGGDRSLARFDLPGNILGSDADMFFVRTC
jgi:hypothetical protein